MFFVIDVVQVLSSDSDRRTKSPVIIDTDDLGADKAAIC